MYASNGEFFVSYIDCLYNCVSAMTVCGLATVNLSGLTVWQQVILFLQMCLGSPVVVSWVMVYMRRCVSSWATNIKHLMLICNPRYFFSLKFEHIIEAETARRLERIETRRLERLAAEEDGGSLPWTHRMKNLLRRRTKLPTVNEVATETSEDGERKKKRAKDTVFNKLRTDMIRRMDDAPRLVDPSGWISSGEAEAHNQRRAELEGEPARSGLAPGSLADGQVSASPKQITEPLPAESEEKETQDSPDGDSKRVPYVSIPIQRADVA